MKLFNDLEAEHGLPNGLLNAVMKQESGGNTRAVSPKGARGAFQFMPATAKQYGVNVDDLTSSATGAAKMYADLLKQNGGDLNKALAGYNWGQGNVQRNGMDKMPAETRQYIQKVTANMKPQAANPFDQFDAVEAKAGPNPFDQFDNAPEAKPVAASGGAKDTAVDTLAGVGKGVGDVALGLQRFAGKTVNAVASPVDTISNLFSDKKNGNVVGDWLVNDAEQGRAKLAKENAPHKERSPIANPGGEIGGNIAATLPVGGILSSVASKAGLPAVATALKTGGFRTGLPAATTAIGKVGQMALRSGAGATVGGISAGLVNEDSAGLGAAIGGFAPPVLAGAGKIAHATGNALRGGGASSEVQALATRAKELGINIPADRIANSRPMNALASSLNYVPFSGRAATEKAMTNQLTRATSKLIGQDGDNMAIALRKASEDLGGKFDHTLKSNAVKLDDNLLRDIVEIDDIAQQQLGGSDYKAIASQVAELLKKGESGAIDGQAAYNIKKTLDRLGRTNNPSAFHALELKKVLMAGLDRSLGPTKAAAFAKTREQYGNMLDLEKIVLNGAEGEISIARLAGMKNINNKPLQEIADITAQFVKTREGNHGAMQRVGAGLGIGSLAGPAWLAGGAVAGAGTNKLLNSNAARNFVMKQPGGEKLNSLANRLGPAAYRSTPVLAADR